MASLFSRLNYTYTDPNSIITTLPNDVTRTLDSMPKMLVQWQADDITNSDTGGYFVNPCANITLSIWASSNNLVSVANNVQGSGNLTGLWTQISTTLAYISNSSTGNTQAGDFLAHTNRISGVTSITVSADQGVANLPHYETAVQTGKAMISLIYQTDGVSNNAPIMGNFTSLFVANDLIAIYNTMSTYANTINSSITISGSGSEMDPFIRISNLTYNVVNAIATTANTANSIFYDRRKHDEQFYKNSIDVLNDYKKVRGIGNSGQSENYLIKNYIGSDKLLSRLE
jgi:hypothetical protein